MTAPSAALAVLAAVVVVGTAIGFAAHGRRRMDLEQWTVGGRKFGLLLVWLLMAGETYTAFTFLGASGWAYSRGGPALYILAYLTLGNVVTFFVGPLLWEAGRRFRLQTQADYFAWRYGGRTLPAVVALLGVAALVPYLEIQLTGLGIIVHISSFGLISESTAMVCAGLLVAGFVLASGIRAVAGISVLKDLLMVAVIATVGFAVPHLHFGGIGPMFTELVRRRPHHFTLPGATAHLGHRWYVSTVLLCATGPAWPHNFATLFTARDAATVRRNAIVLPLYNLSLPLVFFVGLVALLTLPPLANGDLAFMAEVRATFPPWFLGLAGGAGALTAMVPASMMLLTAATLLAKNVARPLLAPDLTDAQVGRLARLVVVAMVGTSLAFALRSSATLVALLQYGYALVGEFFPGIVIGLVWPRMDRAAVLAGMAAGGATLLWASRAPEGLILGCNGGFVALAVNTAVSIASALRPRANPRMS